MPHIHEKIDFVVDVYIVHNHKVLLRNHDKFKEWFAVGGHVELDEDPQTAARRECLEEVGIPITLVGEIVAPGGPDERGLITPMAMDRHRINAAHEHVSLVFAARSETDVIVESPGEKSHGCKWFSEKELEDPQFKLRTRIKQYAKRALALATQPF